MAGTVLLKTILQKISDMDSRITEIEASVATKEELAKVKADLSWSLPEGWKRESEAEKLVRIQDETLRHEKIMEALSPLREKWLDENKKKERSNQSDR